MNDITTNLKDIITTSLKSVFGVENKEDLVMIETPKDKKNGDYSTNIAMRLARDLKTSPLNIANALKTSLENNEIIDKVEIAGPGFINFFIKKDSITSILKTIIEKDDDFGRNNFGNHEKIMVEYVSANPTGDLHLGHARGAAYGDSLTRVLKFSGFDCLREYYVNDAGHQIDVLANSLFLRYKQALNLEINENDIGYQGKDVILLANNIAKEKKDFFKCPALFILFRSQYSERYRCGMGQTESNGSCSGMGVKKRHQNRLEPRIYERINSCLCTVS